MDAARVYLVYRAVVGLALAVGATVFTLWLILRLGLDPLQIILVGTVLEIVVTTCEIPTGVVADSVSRKLSVIVGVGLLGVGFIVFAIPSYTVALASQVLWGLGFTFTSGADIAWITDEVGEERARRLYLRGAQIDQAATIVGIGLGTALGLIELWLPLVLAGAIYLALAVWLWSAMRETAFVRPEAGERDRIHKTIRDARAVLRRRRVLWLVLGVMLLGGLSSEGFDRLWQVHMIEDMGIPGDLDPVVWIGLLQAAGLVAAVAATEAIRRRADLDDLHGAEVATGVLLVAIIAGVAAFGLTGSPWPAAAIFIGVTAVRRASEPVFTTWVNYDLDPRSRATMNSVAEQAWSIGEVAGGPTLGPIAKVASVPTALVTAAFVQIPSLAVLAIRQRQRRGRGTRVPTPTA